jgi:hypothetical protein
MTSGPQTESFAHGWFPPWSAKYRLFTCADAVACTRAVLTAAIHAATTYRIPLLTGCAECAKVVAAGKCDHHSCFRSNREIEPREHQFTACKILTTMRLAFALCCW